MVLFCFSGVFFVCLFVAAVNSLANKSRPRQTSHDPNTYMAIDDEGI